ncbi:MAG: HEAT repeat domain-containing protein [Gemmatimonadales bacterium]
MIRMRRGAPAIVLVVLVATISTRLDAQSGSVASPSADYGKRICEWDGWLPPETGRERYLASKALTNDEDDVLRLALQSRNTLRRDMASRRLAASRDPRSLAALIALENDSSHVVREGMLRSIGRIGSPLAGPVLLRAMVDKDKHIRQAAAWSLGQLRSRNAVGVLVAASRDISEHVRSEAAWSLGMIGDNSAFPVLATMTTDRAKAVRLASVCATGWLGGSVSGPILADTAVSIRAAMAWARVRR